MSRYLVNDPPVPVWEFDSQAVVSDVPPNVIYIRPRMNVEIKGKVTSELFTMGKDAAIEARLGSNETALLIHNIVKWGGPDLDKIPCTPENIRNLDPTEPHIAAVLEEIAVRNKARPSPNPKSSEANGSTSNGAHDLVPSQGVDENRSLQLATGKSNSSLQSAITGRLSKSDDSTLIT